MTEWKAGRAKTYRDGLRIEVQDGLWPRKRERRLLRKTRRLLLANGLSPDIAATLRVRVGKMYRRSQANVGVTGLPDHYRSVNVSLYIHVPDTVSHSVIGHEYGHAWGYHKLYLDWQGDWDSYLEARGLTADQRLDSGYYWDRDEILAEDYRLLCGSTRARNQWPRHLAFGITDPREVEGLREFLSASAEKESS